MTPEQIDRVFGRGRLKMVTGEHVEVFREAVAPGERRRYTKRFLNSTDGDFAHWTEREWRILARLIGHGIGCVPDVVQFHRGSVAGTQLVQTYDAGVTVDQWATLLPLHRGGHVYRHAFEDCAHWWALAHHCLVALKQIHQLQLVHLDVKGDNVCIPLGPANFDPDASGRPLQPLFDQLALIDFAFALVSGESLTAALPIGWQKEYDYQSPRLLKALEDGRDGDLARTRELDWRCDIYSLAAMLKRYLPDDARVHQPERSSGWTSERYDAAKALILELRDHHDRDAPRVLPHQELIDATGTRLRESDLALSLSSAWTLARDVSVAPADASPLTPMTRLALPIRVLVSPHDRASMYPRAAIASRETSAPLVIRKRNDAARKPVHANRAGYAALASAGILALGAAIAHEIFPDATRTALAVARTWLDSAVPSVDSAPSSANTPAPNSEAPPAETAAAADPETPSTAAAVAPETPATTMPPTAVPGTQSAAADRLPDPIETPNVESGDAVAALPGQQSDAVAALPGQRSEGAASPAVAATPGAAPSLDEAAPSPTIARTSTPSAVPQNGAARATGKRIATKSTPIVPPRSSTSAAAARSTAAGRLAMPTHRTAPTMTASTSSAGSPPAAAEAPRIEATPAPVRLAQLVPQAAEATPGEPQVAATQPPHTVPPSSAQQPPASLAPSSAPYPSPANGIAPSSQATPMGPQVSSQEARAPSVLKSSPAARREAAPAASDDWRTAVGVFSQLFGLAKRKPAPIEDRSLQAAASQAQPSRAPQTTATAQDRVAAAGARVDVPLSTISIAQADVPASVPSAVPSSSKVTPPPRDERTSQSLPVTERRAPPQPQIDEPKPLRPEELRPVAPLWIPAPRVLPPTQPMPEMRAASPSPDRSRESDFAMQGRRTLAQAVPRIAVQAQREIDRVLWAAASAFDPKQERTVADFAQAVFVRDNASGYFQGVEPGAARRLNDEAMQAYWIRRNTSEAFDLELKAFGADPNDPEIAGNLALLHLKVTPLQPETARQLALHAIAVRSARFRNGRVEDWNTYAVASALTGRDADARNAMFVTVALAGNVEQNCRAARNALATYGERVREPVEAMLYRIYNQGRAYQSPYCAWPPNWAMGMRGR